MTYADRIANLEKARRAKARKRREREAARVKADRDRLRELRASTGRLERRYETLRKQLDRFAARSRITAKEEEAWREYLRIGGELRGTAATIKRLESEVG